MQHLLSFVLFENKTDIFYGYKIVAYDGIRYYSLYSKKTLNIAIGKTISFGGEGLFLGSSPDFCIDYYSGGTDDQDALLKFEFNKHDIIKGDIDDYIKNGTSGEIQVRKAKLVDIKLLDSTNKMLESHKEKLGNLCEIKINFPEADFWLQRNGVIKNVGKPHKKFFADDIGIKVIATDIIDTNYLYYYLTYLQSLGEFGKLASYTTRLHHIRVVDIKNLTLNFR
jgi:hypothetical protein